MRCGFWHDSIMGPPKMEKRKASKPPSLQEKLADRRQLWGAVQDLILNLALRVPLMRLIDGTGYLCSDLSLQLCRGELGWEPLKAPHSGIQTSALNLTATIHTHLVHRGPNQGNWERVQKAAGYPLSPLRAQMMPWYPTYAATFLSPPKVHTL